MKSQRIDNSNWRKLETVLSKFKSWNSMVAEDGSFYGILLLLVVFSIQVSFKVILRGSKGQIVVHNSGLKIIFGWWPDTMTGQRNFCSVTSRF